MSSLKKSLQLCGWLGTMLLVLLLTIDSSCAFSFPKDGTVAQPSQVAKASPNAQTIVSATPAVTSEATVSATPTVTSKAKVTVFVIMMENHNWAAINGNPSAPYINRVLLPKSSYTQQYYNPPAIHPSEPNYLWLEAGTNFAIYDDNPPAINHQSSTQHLTTLLTHAGISWKAYQEGISGNDCPLTGTNVYAPKHNPMIFFDDVTNSNDPRSAYCIAHERPYSELTTDLKNNSIPRYNFITPNICNDMHDNCAPSYNAVQQGDSWLAQQVPLILASQAYKKGGVLFITWDEGEGSDGPIGMIVFSNNAKGHGYSNSIHYTHSSTLRTVQELLGVTPLLGDAVHATDLRDLFVTFP